MDVLETLGNTTPSLSLIVSLIVGVSLVSVGTTCKKSSVIAISNQNTTSDKTCDNITYTGIGVVVIGILLFYFAQNYNLATFEGLWIIISSVVTCMSLYDVS